jgi:hypothetical protein
MDQNNRVFHNVHQRFVQITQAFDPEATRVLGQAFDMACALLGHTPRPTKRYARPSPKASSKP